MKVDIAENHYFFVYVFEHNYLRTIRHWQVQTRHVCCTRENFRNLKRSIVQEVVFYICNKMSLSNTMVTIREAYDEKCLLCRRLWQTMRRILVIFPNKWTLLSSSKLVVWSLEYSWALGHCQGGRRVKMCQNAVFFCWRKVIFGVWLITWKKPMSSRARNPPPQKKKIGDMHVL